MRFQCFLTFVRRDSRSVRVIFELSKVWLLLRMCLSDYEFSRHLCSPKHFTFTLLTFILNSLSFFVSPLCSYQIYVILLWADLQCYTGWGVFWRIILPKGASNNFYYGMGPWPFSWIADELLSNPPDVCTVCTISYFSRHHSPRRSVTPRAVYGGPWRS